MSNNNPIFSDLFIINLTSGEKQQTKTFKKKDYKRKLV